MHQQAPTIDSEIREGIGASVFKMVNEIDGFNRKASIVSKDTGTGNCLGLSHHGHFVYKK